MTKLSKLKAETAAKRTGAAGTRAALLVLAPCDHFGPKIGGQPCGSPIHRCELHKTTTVRFGRSLDAHRSCGDCPDHTARLKPGGIVIPQPPALDLTPTSSRAVVTIVVGDEARACFAAGGSHMRRYAERVGADLVVLDWPGAPEWPMSAKFAIARVLDHYERIVYADADVLFRPGCLDLFAACAPDEMGLVDELQHHRQNPKFGREAEYQRFREQMGFARVEHLPWMCNCGVMVVPRSHKELLLPPAKPIRPGHCAEQDHTNASLLDSGKKYRLLDRRCNWQNWTDHGFVSAPHDAVLHWSGAGAGRVSRAEQIRQWAAREPWPDRPAIPAFDPPQPTDPDMEIDRRHLMVLADVLTGRHYRRAIEIGSWKGYSTRALLHALDTKMADSVELCEPNPTTELATLVQPYSTHLGPLSVVRMPSVEFLSKSLGGTDFVFVDGDHSAAVVSQEAKMLLDARIPVIAAHDVCAHPGYDPPCDGPPVLTALALAAGYHCRVDARNRLGEKTHRGLLVAVRGAADLPMVDRAFRRWC